MADETVKVRVAVAVDYDGRWFAVGSTEESAGDGGDALGVVYQQDLTAEPRIYWLTAELPVPVRPEPAEVMAVVEGGDG